MREFLMLAGTYSSGNATTYGGWFVSEKLDGMRAFWDGGVSIGESTRSIPWANQSSNKTNKTRVASGLWSRYGNVIHCPDQWSAKLPKGILLDGELYMGRGQFQEVMSVCKKYTCVASAWENVQFHVFDSPKWDTVFMSGEIKNVNFHRMIKNNECIEYGREHSVLEMTGLGLRGEELFLFLDSLAGEIVVPIRQHHGADINAFLDTVVDDGGEGLMLRNPLLRWMPYRVNDLLKVKKMLFGEGKVLGMTEGKGKYIGMMGALIIEWRSVVFEISGFTDAERDFIFQVGEKVKFQYTGVTNRGIPRHAQYKRT